MVNEFGEATDFALPVSFGFLALLAVAALLAFAVSHIRN